MGTLMRCLKVLARMRGLANGVDPRWGVRTVYVCDETGCILRFEERRLGRLSQA